MLSSLRNGEPVKSEFASDRSQLYGDGVFTTILFQDHQALYLDKHLERLSNDSSSLMIKNLSMDTIKAQFHSATKTLKEGIVRISISRSSGGRGYLCIDAEPVIWITINELPVHIKTLRIDGVNLRYCEQRLSQNPSLAGIKHCNRLEQVLARNEWQDEYHEGLMFDFNDQLIEGTMSNVFMIKADTLFTANLELSGVDGIIRREVINIAKQYNIPIEIAHYTKSDLEDADAVFITNSVIGIWPVNSVETLMFKQHAMIERLQNKLKHY